MSYDYADSEVDTSVIADLRKRVAELETALRQAAAPQGREALIEECARIAEADAAVTECPYGTDKPGDPTWNHTDNDPCPVCGQTGKDDGSKCHGLARQRIAERIRAVAPDGAGEAQPKLIDNDQDEITVSLDGRELRGWSYASDDERRTKMLAAREYVEGWCDGRETR